MDVPQALVEPEAKAWLEGLFTMAQTDVDVEKAFGHFCRLPGFTRGTLSAMVNVCHRPREFVDCILNVMGEWEANFYPKSVRLHLIVDCQAYPALGPDNSSLYFERQAL